MRPDDGSRPVTRKLAERAGRLRETWRAAPFALKAALLLALVVVWFPLASVLIAAAFGYAPFAVWAARRSVAASLSVAVWGLAVVTVVAVKTGNNLVPCRGRGPRGEENPVGIPEGGRSWSGTNRSVVRW